MDPSLTRRTALAAAALGVLAPSAFMPRAVAQPAPGAPGGRRSRAVTIWRNGSHIGRHHVGFESGAAGLAVAIEAEMLVKIGPIPVFNYHHQATETWRDGRFAALQSRTTTNGKREEVAASRTAEGVAISRGAALPPVQAVADAHPLTHWNAEVLQGPLFNPQTGAILHLHVVRSAGEPLRLADARTVSSTRYALTGDTEITDWYDDGGAWAALRAKGPDGSYVEYRRDA